MAGGLLVFKPRCSSKLYSPQDGKLLALLCSFTLHPQLVPRKKSCAPGSMRCFMGRLNYRFIRSVPWLIALIVTLAAWQWHRVSKTRVQPFESWLLDQRVMENIQKEPVTKDIGVII